MRSAETDKSWEQTAGHHRRRRSHGRRPLNKEQREQRNTREQAAARKQGTEGTKEQREQAGLEGRRGFRRLLAWQKADDLASAVFRVTNALPTQQRWMGVQLIRAAVSVPANIAEGYGRGSLGDYLRFLDIARGSLSEVEYYVHFLLKEGLISEEDGRRLSTLRAETGLILHKLWLGLKEKAPATWNHDGSFMIRETPLDVYGADAEV